MRAWMLLASAALHAQDPAATFQNRDAWTIEADQLRVTILQSGGHIAEIRLREPGSINPLWIPARQTIDADRFDPARDAARFGGGAGARLMSGLMGHNVCFPFWGNPSEAEFRAGMTFHGETGVTRWRRLPASQGTLVAAADLPESRTRFTRTVRIAGQVAYFEGLAENLSGWDRPVGWCEHATLGPPFLEKAVTTMDASVTRGRKLGDASGTEFVWPQGEAETRIDLRQVRDIAQSGFVNHFLVDPGRKTGWVAAVHPKQRLLFAYLFRRADFPWLNVWEANNPDMLTRGLEFSNTPVHGTMKALVASGPLFGERTYDWLDALASLRKRFCALLVQVPAGFEAVADIRAGARIEIVERGRGRVVTLDWDPAWLDPSSQ